MSFLKATGIMTLIYITCIILVDIAGALLVTILPEPGSIRLNGQAGFGSSALYYAVWMVAGCFTGVFYTAGSWEAVKECRQVQQFPYAICIVALTLSAVVIALLYKAGEMKTPAYISTGNYYVPGHRYMTYTFFISLLLTCLLLLYMRKKTGLGATNSHHGNSPLRPLKNENYNKSINYSNNKQ